MTPNPERPRPAWLVVFEDETSYMGIVGVHPAPENPDAEVYAELDAACLSTVVVEAATTDDARRCARQRRDIARIQDICARARRSPAATPHGEHRVRAVGAPDLALTPAAAARAGAIVQTALRAAHRHRPVNARHVDFEQFVGSLTPHASAVVHQHAAPVATGRNDEAVAALVHGLNGVAVGLR